MQLSDIQDYQYVQTFMLPEDDPELSDPEVMARFQAIRNVLEDRFNKLGYADKYSFTMRATKAADFLGIGKSTVHDLDRDKFIFSIPMNDGANGKLFCINNLIDYLAKRHLKKDQAIENKFS